MPSETASGTDTMCGPNIAPISAARFKSQSTGHRPYSVSPSAPTVVLSHFFLQWAETRVSSAACTYHTGEDHSRFFEFEERVVE